MALFFFSEPELDPENKSPATLRNSPPMVCVLPDPVCPYAKTTPTWPAIARFTRGAPSDTYKSSSPESAPKNLSNAKVCFSSVGTPLKLIFGVNTAAVSVLPPFPGPEGVTHANALPLSCLISCSLSGRTRAATVNVLVSRPPFTVLCCFSATTSRCWPPRFNDRIVSAIASASLCASSWNRTACSPEVGGLGLDDEKPPPPRGAFVGRARIAVVVVIGKVATCCWRGSSVTHFFSIHKTPLKLTRSARLFR